MNQNTKRRMVENELVIRDANIQAQKIIEHDFEESESNEIILQFFCECSDLDCSERIPLTVQQYRKAHKSKAHFIALPTHEQTEIETVVKKAKGFNVLQKFKNLLRLAMDVR